MVKDFKSFLRLLTRKPKQGFREATFWLEVKNMAWLNFGQVEVDDNEALQLVPSD